MSEQGTVEIDQAKIFYDFLPGDGPTIFFLPALNHTRHGAKANAIKTWCRRQGRSFLVADYFGMGKSDGEYKVMPHQMFCTVGCGNCVWHLCLLSYGSRPLLAPNSSSVSSSLSFLARVQDATITRWATDAVKLMDYVKKEKVCLRESARLVC